MRANELRERIAPQWFCVGVPTAETIIEFAEHGERKTRAAVRWSRVVGPPCHVSVSRTATSGAVQKGPECSWAQNKETPLSTDPARQKRECCTARPTQPRADSAKSRNLAPELYDAAAHATRLVHQESCISSSFGGVRATPESSST